MDKMRGFVHGVISGHGGVDENGKYHILKEGSKQAKVGDRMIYEGEHNRYIRDEILTQSVAMGVKTIDLIPEIADVPLLERVQRINAAKRMWEKQGFRLIIWELHLNAFNGNVSGTEIYTTRKQNFSDTMASVWWEKAESLVPAFKGRADYGDGDPDKEKDFYVIKNSHSFATLIEFFFFDHAPSVEKYCNPDGYHLWASTVTHAMKQIDLSYDPNTLDNKNTMSV